MTDMLQEHCIRYTQDFDLLFEHDTDPIDLFCQQHDAEQQKATAQPTDRVSCGCSDWTQLYP